jgi:peptide/nickel transport system permease protein
LLFSLPIFWVAVLLKQYLAIEFNNFLSDPNIPIPWVIIASIISGIFWSGIIGGDRKRVWTIFGFSGISTGALLVILDAIHWFTHPFLGPVFIFILGVGVAYGVTLLSTGLSNKSALKASQTMALFAVIFYYPTQQAFKLGNHTVVLLGLEILTLVIAFFTARFFAKIDKGPAIRTTMITAFVISLLVFLDKLMQTWHPYMQTDAVNFRPIPTTGQVNALLDPTQWWFTTLDLFIHMLLPTIALTLISFAGYIRYSRGTLLEVLNQDYIRTARAKGLSERTVIMRHAFRNTLIPLTTIMVVDFAGILGGAAITERVFGWIGMGTLSLQAIGSFDLNLLMGTSLILGFLSVFANLVADLLYSALDPRIRAGKGA